jgi:hypothetical protein
MVVTIQVKQPKSLAARCWNISQKLVSAGALALIVLKLTSVITWSWWWVLSPIWISGVTGVLVITGVVILLRREAKRQLCPDLLNHVAATIQQLPADRELPRSEAASSVSLLTAVPSPSSPRNLGPRRRCAMAR